MSKFLKTSLIGAAAFIALSAFAGSANAVTIDANGVVFTWDPAVFSPTSPQFTADNTIYTDFANAVINGTTGAFTESGVLEVQTFAKNGTTVASPAIQNYGVYFVFNVSGAGSFSGGNFTGAITALNFSLEIDPNAAFGCQATSTCDTITNSGSVGTHTLVDAGTPDVTLANGTLAVGPNPNVVSIVAGIPGASASTTFIPTATGISSGFFVDPTALQYINMNILLAASFINTATVENVGPCVGAPTNTCVDIHGGGGNATFVVPEPASLSIFGAALIGFGFAARRRKNKQA